MTQNTLHDLLAETVATNPPLADRVTPYVHEQLIAFVELLAKWNNVHNLSAVRSLEAMVPRHLIDSLTVLPWLPVPAACAAGQVSESGYDVSDHSVYDLIDIGSGAGLPVLPLAIVRPDLTCLSIESNNKKIRFQQQAKLELYIDNVTVTHARVEMVNAQGRVVTSRAFAAPDAFLDIAKPLCAPGGTVLIMLGQADRMPADLPEGFELIDMQRVESSGASVQRHIAVCRRV